MDIQILIGFLLTILPISELRGGLPVIVEYCVRNGVSIWPYFLAVLILNISVIFIIFMFFDFAHKAFMKYRWYRNVIGRILNKMRNKTKKIKNRMNAWGYFGLMFFVAIPLVGTGAWTGTTIAWMLELDRLKSFAAIASGVVIAGLIILLFSLGLFNGLY